MRSLPNNRTSVIFLFICQWEKDVPFVVFWSVTWFLVLKESHGAIDLR
jgi:hypothetical protein